MRRKYCKTNFLTTIFATKIHQKPQKQKKNILTNKGKITSDSVGITYICLFVDLWGFQKKNQKKKKNFDKKKQTKKKILQVTGALIKPLEARVAFKIFS